MKQTRLGDILLRKQAINKEQLAQAQREMKLNGVSLTAELVKAGLFTEENLAKFIGKSFGRPVIDLNKVDIKQDLTDIPLDMLRKNAVIPIHRKGNAITLAVADPYDINALDEIAFISGSQVDVVVVTESQILEKLEPCRDRICSCDLDRE